MASLDFLSCVLRPPVRVHNARSLLSDGSSPREAWYEECPEKDPRPVQARGTLHRVESSGLSCLSLTELSGLSPVVSLDTVSAPGRLKPPTAVAARWPVTSDSCLISGLVTACQTQGNRRLNGPED
ncbi:hypothetical protein ElyMa_002837900 [Elysia marginata]|uniref:Uncharacterized protein n=1 Tax=Elysia marginata TaxID=1093978 RepID=A0AAV4HUL9_9GAST|nr:hypothetical protein ElyMa_002837900 [Elysia marginata]